MHVHTPHLLRRGAAAALPLLLAAAATASAGPTLSLEGSTLRFQTDGAQRDDYVLVDPYVIDGRGWIDLYSSEPLAMAASAAERCDLVPGAAICRVDGLSGISAFTGPGDDSVTMVAPFAGEPSLRLFASGGVGEDTLLGGIVDDSLVGGAGADTVAGGSGLDTLVGGEGIDSVTGDGGDDVLYGDDAGTQIGPAVPSRSGDTLAGGAGDDLLYGEAGDDRVDGEEGDDTAFGDLGADVVTGGRGDDTLDGALGNDAVYGGYGNDALVGGPGSDRLDGSFDSDTADYSDRDEPLVVTLDEREVYVDGGALDDADGSGPLTRRDALLSIEKVLGGAGEDQLGTVLPQTTLDGGAGDDTLDGGPFGDVLLGGAGDDLLTGGHNVDVMAGGPGLDALRARDRLAEPALDCGEGDDSIEGDAADATSHCEAISLDAAPGPVVGGGELPPGFGSGAAGGGSGGSGAGGSGSSMGGAGTGGVGGPAGTGTGPAGNGPTAARVAVGIDVRFARARSARSVRGVRGVRVTRVRLTRVPRGATVAVVCRARRRAACPGGPFVKTYVRAVRRADLIGRLRGRVLPTGTVLELRVTKPGATGVLRRFTVVREKAPTSVGLCLPAGSAAATAEPIRCPAA